LQGHDNPEKILHKPRTQRKEATVPNVPDGNVSDHNVHNVSDHGALALEVVGADAPRLLGPSERSISYQTVLHSQDGTDSFEEDPLAWYRNVGYLISLDESAIDVLEQVVPPYTMNDIKRKLFKKKDRDLGLEDRNVRLVPSVPPDPFLAVFHHMKPVQKTSLYLPDFHEDVKKYHIDEWKLDLDKVVKDKLEATFQRTVMMSMLDRVRLVYNLRDGDQPVLDFAVESHWNCPFMPTRALKKTKPNCQRVLSRPKPDISVAFHLPSIIEDGYINALPEAIKRIMVYEAQTGTGMKRAFHFLMIEAKNAGKTSTDEEGQLQNLSSASQSLHCLYEFFNEADRQEVECNKTCCTPPTSATTDNAGGEQPSVASSAAPAKKPTFVDLFFKEVRVFTAVATGRAITIRVHRACPAHKPPFPAHQGRPPYQLIILPDYPLQFEYNEVCSFTNADFSRESLVDTFQKIMVDYGIGRLRPLLQKAAAAIGTKFYAWEEEHGKQYVLGMRHYSHGQTAPPPSSSQNSQAASQSTRWSSPSGSSTSRPQSRSRRASSILSTNSQAAYHSFTSQPLEGPIESPRKRTRRG
jgi:hypothetical protein